MGDKLYQFLFNFVVSSIIRPVKVFYKNLGEWNLSNIHVYFMIQGICWAIKLTLFVDFVMIRIKMLASCNRINMSSLHLLYALLLPSISLFEKMATKSISFNLAT